MNFSVDISIVLFDSAPHLPGLFESLLAQTFPLTSATLCLRDQSANDDTSVVVEQWEERLRQRFGHVEVCRGPNVGFGAGHNANLAHGHSPLALIMNPDLVLQADTIQSLVDVAGSDSADCAAWEPRQIPYEHPKAYDPISLEVPWASGAALLLRRAAFDAVGGFDERIFLYGEDVDLSWRLQDAGFKLKYVPAVTVRHNTYTVPGELKEAQYFGSTLSHLCLRTRFGSVRDLLAGVMMYAALFVCPANVPRRRRRLLANSVRYLRRLPHFVMSRSRRRRKFYGWDYAPTRMGAFVVTGERPPAGPLVSVLVRTTGVQPLLDQALQSLCHQTYKNFEVVVVEDSEGRLNQLGSAFPALNLKHLPLGRRQGRCVAGNAALENASGELCLFLDDDDFLYPDHLEHLVARRAGIEDERACVYSAAFQKPTTLDEQGNILSEREPIHFYDHGATIYRLLVRNRFPILTVLFPRSLYSACGGFDEELDNLEDWNLWVRFACAGATFHGVPKTTAVYRVPAERAADDQRQRRLDSYYALARQKHSHLQVTLSVAELTACVEESWDAEFPGGRSLKQFRNWVLREPARRRLATSMLLMAQAARRMAQTVRRRLGRKQVARSEPSCP